MLSKIGAEPTGDPFNTISLDDVSGRAFNPMVNAGAIVTATLVAGRTRAEQFDRILDGLSAFAGRRAGRRRGRLRLGARHRRPEPRHRLPDALRRPDRPRRERPGGDVLPPVLDRGDRPGPRGDGGDAGQRRGEPDDRGAGDPAARRRAGADGDEHVRDVRLRRRVAVPGRDAGQERGERGHLGGPARADGTRRAQPAAGSAGQQRPGRGGVRAALVATRAAPAAADRALAAERPAHVPGGSGPVQAHPAGCGSGAAGGRGPDDRGPRAGRRPGVRRGGVTGPHGAVGPGARPVAGAGHGPGHADRRGCPDPVGRAGRPVAG